MENNILSFKERLEMIVEQSYDILCQQIANGRFNVYNEASLQMQFSAILKAVGQLYEFDPKDRFFIELETNVNLEEATCKSGNKNARCDIWLGLTGSYNKIAECAIELKYFKKSDGETSTDNRFSIFKDLENLEHYKKDSNGKLLCYEIVYTNNPNYPNEHSRSYLNIGNGCEHTGEITSNHKTVTLANNYKFNWNEYLSKDNSNNHYFLKMKIGE